MTTRKATHGNLTAVQIASYLLAALALAVTLKAGLLLALFSGLLVYALVHALAPAIARRIKGRQSRMIAVALLAVIVVTGLTAGV